MKSGYLTAYHERVRSRNRRRENAMKNRCINENSRLTHGPATNGVRCSTCATIHKRSR